MILPTSRRDFLRAASFAVGAIAVPGWARSGTGGLATGSDVLSGEAIKLSIGHAMHRVGGRAGHAIAINGTVPGPLIRLKEGQNVRLSVTNTLAEDTSIHWHGLLLPFQYDGVPGISFPGIKPGETFVYDFPIRQAGTYWYHSHSGLQEAMGHFGLIVIDPAGVDPVTSDREHVLVLSDWSFMHPHKIYTRLKQNGGHFNFQKQTLAGLARRQGPVGGPSSAGFSAGVSACRHIKKVGGVGVPRTIRFAVVRH